jgi:hypothetical protein
MQFLSISTEIRHLQSLDRRIARYRSVGFLRILLFSPPQSHLPSVRKTDGIAVFNISFQTRGTGFTRK